MSNKLPERCQMEGWLSRISKLAFVSTVIMARHLLQLNLKSFLWIVYCIAMVGSSIIVAIDVASKDKAIDAILAEDGFVYLSSANGHCVTSSNELDPTRIIASSFDSKGVARIIRQSAAISSLVDLDVGGSTFDPDSLADLALNPRMRTLTLDSCEGLTPETCSLLVRAFPQLREISLDCSDIRKDGLAALSELTFLRTIDVSEVSITATDIVHVCASFPALKHLTIANADLSGQLNLFCGLPNLETLDVSIGRFSETDLANFLGCAACKKVIVTAVRLDRRKVESLVPESLDIVDWGLPITVTKKNGEQGGNKDWPSYP